MNIVFQKEKEKFYFVGGISPFVNQMKVNYSLDLILRNPRTRS